MLVLKAKSGEENFRRKIENLVEGAPVFFRDEIVFCEKTMVVGVMELGTGAKNESF